MAVIFRKDLAVHHFYFIQINGIYVVENREDLALFRTMKISEEDVKRVKFGCTAQCCFKQTAEEQGLKQAYLGYGNVVGQPHTQLMEICHQSRWRDWGCSAHFHCLGWVKVTADTKEEKEEWKGLLKHLTCVQITNLNKPHSAALKAQIYLCI